MTGMMADIKELGMRLKRILRQVVLEASSMSCFATLVSSDAGPGSVSVRQRILGCISTHT
jgi:hypothetical protein